MEHNADYVSADHPIATCGLCEWRLQGDDYEAVMAEALRHCQTDHPNDWAVWQKAQRNARYFLTGEGDYER